MEDTTTELTEREAISLVIKGVNRESKRDANQARDLIHDAVALRDQNVRKLATIAESKGRLKVGFDSYLSYISNAKGVAAMFDWDKEAIDAFMDETDLKGLTAIYKAFRDLFGPEKPEKEPTPLIDVVLGHLEHLTPEERARVADAIWAMDNEDEEVPELEAA